MHLFFTTLATLASASLVRSQLCNKPRENPDTPNVGFEITIKPIGGNKGDVATVGAPQNISWGGRVPSTSTVTIQLWTGPAENLKEIACLANGAPTKGNNGQFDWTPTSDLASGGYGISVVADSTGEWQWSNHFEISNSKIASSSVGIVSTSSVPPTVRETTATYPINQLSDGQLQQLSTNTLFQAIATATSTHAFYSASQIYYPSSSGFPPSSANATYSIKSQKPESTKLPKVIASTGAAVDSTQYIQPTGALTVPSDLPAVTQTAVAGGGGVTPVVNITPNVSSTPTSTPLVATGAAQKMLGGGMVAALGGFAAVML